MVDLDAIPGQRDFLRDLGAEELTFERYAVNHIPRAFHDQELAPDLAKPAWIFGPVVQLVFNSLWSVLFFGLHSPDMAAMDIVLLWMAILLTLIVFWKRSRLGDVLLEGLTTGAATKRNRV